MRSEAFLRQFHAAHAGITSRALARGGSYERLAAQVARDARVLDLGCGDGHLLAMLGPRAVGLDISREELALANRPCVHARAQQLPFADRAFDAVVSHLAFMLMDEPTQVVAELARVLVPGGAFHAILGGGPTAHGDDAFHRFLALAKPRGQSLGDPRTKSEAGWRALFAGWRVDFERWEIDLAGTLDEVWGFLSASYQTHDDVRAQLAAEFGPHLPCTVVLWNATARSGYDEARGG
ncbi:MAG: class I SAM-dependent methyltransferase [Myxococcota bacterium]|nr:class I SAM-dependent methyltransferase [Myxococcota bacterium]